MSLIAPSLKRPGLSELRQIPGIISSQSLPSFGNSSFPKGAITELSGRSGTGKTSTVLKYLAQNPSFKVAWIEEERTIFPRSFPMYGVSLDRVLFIEGGKESFWGLLQSIRSQLFDALIYSGKSFHEKNLRRLQIEAERNFASVLLLTEKSVQKAYWPIRYKVQMKSQLRRSVCV